MVGFLLEFLQIKLGEFAQHTEYSFCFFLSSLFLGLSGKSQNNEQKHEGKNRYFSSEAFLFVKHSNYFTNYFHAEHSRSFLVALQEIQKLEFYQAVRSVENEQLWRC